MKSKPSSTKVIAIGLLLLFTFPVAASAIERGEPIVPFLNCKVWIPDQQRLVAFFGYHNPNAEAVTIEIGPGNIFVPSPGNRGQLTEFKPGIHPRAFYVIFNPFFEQWIVWNLNGSTVRVELDSTQFCHPSVLSLAVTGSGTIAADPAIPACQDACSTSVEGPASFQLMAIPEPGWSFSGYSGDEDCIDGEVTLEAGSLIQCRASFDPPDEHTLAVAVFGNGNVTSSIGGIDCPTASCIADIPQSAKVALTATPSPGATFLRWAGDADCLDGNLTVDADTVCSAVFVPPLIFMDNFEQSQ